MVCTSLPLVLYSSDRQLNILIYRSGNHSLPITPVTPTFPTIKDNAPRLPPHLRWKEKLSPKTPDVAGGEPGSSQAASRASIAAEQMSPPLESAAERSRIKEQARLDTRTGVAKVKGPRGEEVPLQKYEGSDTRNATLASAKLDKPFSCPITDCAAGYHTKDELLKHKYNRHEYCKRCKLWFENKYMLHIHKVEAPAHIICAVCSVEFYTGAARDAHTKQVRFSDPFE